jgi:hypothetical protein
MAKKQHFVGLIFNLKSKNRTTKLIEMTGSGLGSAEHKL